jgi:enamine deaminase RidA (YjgF/YER057c/UK114 family)
MAKSDLKAPAPIGIYEPFAVVGNLMGISAISSAREGELLTGKVGRDLELAAAQEAARRAADNLLAVLYLAIGEDVGRLERILMVRGYVNAAEDFDLIHKVVDAASERIIGRLGDRGRHARSAIGCSTLPNNSAVTLEAIVALRGLE